jgi:hypothetical protein
MNSFLATSLDLSLRGIFPSHPNPEEDPKCKEIGRLVQLHICKIPRTFTQEMVWQTAKRFESQQKK